MKIIGEGKNSKIEMFSNLDREDRQYIRFKDGSFQFSFYKNFQSHEPVEWQDNKLCAKLVEDAA